MKELDLKEKQVLGKIADLAAYNASKSLSKMSKKKVNISISWADSYPIEKIPRTIGGAQKIITVVYLEVKNSIGGCILLVFSKESAAQTADLLQNRKIGTTKQLDDIDLSALKELGNIIANSYINALSLAFNVNLLDSVPHIAIDMTNAIIGSVLSQYAAKAEKAMVLKTKITIAKHNVESNIMMFFDPDSYKLLRKYLKECDIRFMLV